MDKKILTVFATAFLAGLYGCGDSNSTSADSVPNVLQESVQNVSLLPISNLSKDLCGDLWCESDDDGKIETGSDEETAGYWFMFSDSMEPYKGNSDIKLSYDVEADKDDGGEYSHFFCGGNFFCGSELDIKIQGTATLGDAYSNPFVGIGFNLVSEKREPMDISSWEGVCLVYSSTGKLALELAPSGNPLVLESNNFGYELPKTSAVSMINVPWSAFGLYDVSKSPSTDPLWTVQNAAAIELRFYENSDFYVYSIGRYGTCSNEVSVPASSATVPASSATVPASSATVPASSATVPASSATVPTSSSSTPKSSASSEQKGVNDTFLWKAPEKDGRVVTGSPDETSGYWYYYDDNYYPNNGDSKIVFPSDVEEDEFGNVFGPLNVKYGGIKADVQIGPAYEYGFAGLGFNIWSEIQEGVDITKWEGICLTYSSTGPFYIELGPEDEASYAYINYKATVPASETVTTVNVPWKMYRIPWGCPGHCSVEDVLDKIAQIKLRFEKSGEFLLKEIGSLDACGK